VTGVQTCALPICSPQFGVLLFFGLINLATVGCVIFPGGRAA